LIDLDGADNVTIDGRVNQSGSTKDLIITNTSTSGTSTIRFINDASNNTVKYCTIKGASTATWNAGTILFLTAGSGSGNGDNTIDNNNFTCATDANRPVSSVYSNGTSGKENSGNIISNNNFYNIFRRSAYSNGIIISSNNTNWTVSGNSFYETSDLITTSDDPYYMIWINNAGINYTITGNYIGGSSSQCGGTAYVKSGTTSFNNNFSAIYINTGAGTASSVQGNTIKNFSWSNSGGASWYGINIQGGSVNIGNTTGNTIGAATGTGSITLTNAAAGGVFYGIYILSAGTVNASNNTIGSITTANSNPIFLTSFYGVCSPSSGNLTVTNNVIGSTSTTNSINASSTSTGNSQEVCGIFNSGSGSSTISGNTIANMKNNATGALGALIGIVSTAGVNTITDNTIANSNTGTSSSASIVGIFLISTSAGQTISGNNIYNLSNTNSGSEAVDNYGIYYSGPSSGTNIVEKNFIHSLTLASSSTSASIYGIDIEGGTATYSNNIISLGSGVTTGYTIYGIKLLSEGTNTLNLYYNTVDIEGTVTGVTSNTYSLSNSNGGSNFRNYRNNIFNNSRSGGSTGKHYAISVAVVTNLTIDYDDYYAPNGVLGSLTGVDKTTLGDWKTATGGDVNSFNINPSFALAGGTSTANYLPSETSLIAVTGTGITTDYSGITRSGTYPAMGAIEYTVSPPCSNPTSGGTIGNAQSNCGSYDPSAITSLTLPTGHTGTLEYKWQLSITSSSSGFSDIASSNSSTYDPSTITQTTWYKRIARVSCMSDWTGAAESGVVAMTVVPTSIEVANTSDAGAGSLRQAINDICVGGTISFNNSLNGSTITLTSGQLDITKGLVINASSLSSGISVSGNNSSMVFNISSGTSTFSGFTITQGSSYDGAGMYIATGTNVTVSNVTFSNCTAVVNGGAIYQDGGTSSFTNCTIQNNHALWGAGVNLKAGTMGLTNCNVTSNSSIADGSAGGGIYHKDGSLTLTNTSVTSNSTVSYAGGIYVENSTAVLTIDNSHINSNTTTNGRGAGLFMMDGTVSIINSSTVNSNAAQRVSSDGDGGGIYLYKGSLTLTNSTMDANSAARDGGGIMVVDATAALTSSGSTISNNAAGTGYGAGIYLYSGNAGFTTTTISGNQNANKGAGICIWNPASTVTLNNCTVTNNLTTNGVSNSINYGGGIFIDNAIVTISNTTFSGNKGTHTNDAWGPKGGAVFIYQGTLTNTDNTFTDNEVNTSQGKGGAIFNDLGTVTNTDCTFSGNDAGRSGGAIFSNNASSSTSNTGCTFTLNTSGRLGGAIYMENGTLYNDDCSLTYNSTILAGGAINHNNGTSTNTTCTIKNNTSSGACGGFYIKSGTATITGSEITDNNSSPTDGSDISAILNSVINISNTTAENIYSENKNFVVGSSDFTVTGAISGTGLITPISTGYVKMNIVKDVPLLYPLTDGTNDLSITITCLNSPTNPVQISIHHDKTGVSLIMSDFWNIIGDNNLNATLMFNISKTAISGEFGLIRYWNGSRYVPIPQERTTIEDKGTYYQVSITGINQFNWDN
jgi:predicted outer membrane repeat protein